MEYFKLVSLVTEFNYFPGVYSRFRDHGKNIGYDVIKQLRYRAQVYNLLDIADKKRLSYLVIFSYELIAYGNSLISRFNLESRFLAGLIFTPSYLLLKMYSLVVYRVF
jgi:hypothetical protein